MDRFKRQFNSAADAFVDRFQGDNNDNQSYDEGRAYNENRPPNVQTSYDQRGSGNPEWLHGTLHVTVHQANDLPEESGTLDFIGDVANRVLRKSAASDAFVKLQLGPCSRARTGVKENARSAEWNEQFVVDVADKVAEVVFEVHDADWLGANLLGLAKVPVQEVASGEDMRERWLPLVNKAGRPIESGGSLCVSLRFVAADSNRDYSFGVGDGSQTYDGIPNTFFSIKQGNRVTLFQDAHQEPGTLPEVWLENGQRYEPQSLWDNLYKCIFEAEHFIYLTGWSVLHTLQLVRNGSYCPPLGELLKQKAEQGVRVCMLVWDDRTSLDAIKRAGVMATHDEDTEDFFRGSNVICKLCPRDGSTQDNRVVESLTIDSIFTHHQKTVICDAATHDGRGRRVVAFVGGIDVTDGRFDTAQHSLFHTLEGVHAEDYYQSCVVGAVRDQGGPREPWHDIHSMLEGPVAWDVHENFVQRWRRQESDNVGDLLQLDRVEGLETPDGNSDWQGDERLFVVNPWDPEAWRVQVLRSIDSDSADGFPESNQDATQKYLATGNGRTIDYSIQRGYVHAIRRAQHFIYIENQYFLGSCQGWEAQRDAGAIHLIPMEIALKIVNKIRAGERFTAYIVVPMYPEGAPDSGAVQIILHYQARTMAMMYRLIAQALQQHGPQGAHPRDYLQFFCLGNREGWAEGDLQATQEPGEQLARVQASRRFMIYVHAKMMVVDDEYVIVGSANINQRSMDGSRDTEIAMGAHQPNYLIAKRDGQLPRGQVHGFRMSLWGEHTKQLRDEFLNPQELECAQLMREIGDSNWQAFMADEVSDLPGHLMSYPISVEWDGSVGPIPGCENIPDFDAPVLGTEKTNLPSILTT